MISDSDQVGFYQTFHCVLIFLWCPSRLRHRSTSDPAETGVFQPRPVPATEAKRSKEEKAKQNQS